MPTIIPFASLSAPGMGNNLVVKDHTALGIGSVSGKILKTTPPMGKTAKCSTPALYVMNICYRDHQKALRQVGHYAWRILLRAGAGTQIGITWIKITRLNIEGNYLINQLGYFFGRFT